MNRNESCRTNTTYASDFGWSPAHLSFACLLNGFEPVPLDRPFTYFEFSFGQEPAVNRFAANAPHGRFYATECNRHQAVTPQNRVADPGLSNPTLLANSVAELAQGLAGLPQFDFIVTRRDYDHIPAESRRNIVDFIARHLKPGGIVYTGYNAMPGGATGHPLQQLMLEYEAFLADVAGEQSYKAFQAEAAGEQSLPAHNFVQTLADHDAKYFDSNPGMHALWEGIKEQPARCLNGLEPLYFADVARDFAAAKLDFAGAADLRLAFPQHYLTADQQGLLNTVPDMVLRETLKDYVCNTAYRSDVFVRGARRMHPVRRQHWLERSGLALTGMSDKAEFAYGASTGRINVPDTASTAVLDALAERPLTLAELAGLPVFRDQNATVLETAALLVTAGQAVPFFANCRPIVKPQQRPRHDRHTCANTEKRKANALE